MEGCKVATRMFVLLKPYNLNFLCMRLFRACFAQIFQNIIRHCCFAEPPKKKSSKQRFKELNKKEAGGDLMDAYTDKPPPQEVDSFDFCL